MLVSVALAGTAACASASDAADPELTREDLAIVCDAGVEDQGPELVSRCAPPATVSAQDLDGVPSWVPDLTPNDGLPSYTNVNNPFVGGCVEDWNNGTCNGNPANTKLDLCGTNGLDEQIAGDAAGMTATTNMCLAGGSYAGAGNYSDCSLECKQAQGKLGLAQNGGACVNANSQSCGGMVGRCVCDPKVVTVDLVN
ncbi:MAG TPA: hypothetical protein VKB80_22925 [Kofleriaceae bacterium]|nr:hypothetical protein [Kofleriaceae bacterium]